MHLSVLTPGWTRYRIDLAETLYHLWSNMETGVQWSSPLHTFSNKETNLNGRQSSTEQYCSADNKTQQSVLQLRRESWVQYFNRSAFICSFISQRTDAASTTTRCLHLLYALIECHVLAFKNSTQHCVTSYPGYLCLYTGDGLAYRLWVLGTWFYERPYRSDSDLLFLFLLTNVLIVKRSG